MFTDKNVFKSWLYLFLLFILKPMSF